jgi:predicted metalloprotease
MRWNRGGGNPGDLIDARGGGGGRMGGLPVGRAGGGLGLVGVIIYLAVQVLGGGGGGGFAIDDPFGAGAGGGPVANPIPAAQDPERDLRDFSSYVFSNAQDGWERIFAQQGKRYDRAKLVLFRRGVQTGCGSASSAVGPFYCPADRRVFLDLSFYKDMTDQLAAKGGDFAWAYVIAHETGHHVQQQLGTSSEVDRMRRSHPDDANALSVRLELQADCYAGVWAHGVFAAGDLEQGDVEEAVDAAGAVGDDRLQRRAGGGVNPDSFTHGTSAQRVDWFNRGRKAGDPADCDTFSADEV